MNPGSSLKDNPRPSIGRNLEEVPEQDPEKVAELVPEQVPAQGGFRRFRRTKSQSPGAGSGGSRASSGVVPEGWASWKSLAVSPL